jgi:1,4-alpha-glucan branching enzyme
MHCGRSRYVNVINKDEASITTKVTVKQLRYIPITPMLKWLFMCEETTQQMMWNKERIHDNEDVDIVSHPTDAEAWQALNHFDPEFVRDPGVFVLVYRRIVSILTTSIVLRTLVGQFS